MQSKKTIKIMETPKTIHRQNEKKELRKSRKQIIKFGLCYKNYNELVAREARGRGEGGKGMKET